MNTEEHRTPVVWRPQPRQAEFMRRPEPEVTSIPQSCIHNSISRKSLFI